MKPAKETNDERMFKKLSETLCELTRVLREGLAQRKTEFEWFKSHAGLATKQDLAQMEQRIMSKISEYVASVNESYDAIDIALEALGKSQNGLIDDVAFLKDTIEKLNNNPGPITPEDQALLDAALLRTRGQADKVTAAKAALEALDAATDRPAEPPPQP